MTATTDLRAALREAAAMLESYSEIGFYSDAAKARAKVAEFRALADAPSTVAELLARVDAGHEVRWSVNDEERRAIDGGDGQIHFQWRTGDGSRWRDRIVNHADLTAPARLVEVSP